ncbi:MAG: DASS family sodium-coupled anion symporter [Gemmatimonadetes bacterium]|nr:DASS family sodium-coupled anion symporter [Gemmatimonadota bacterium]
MFDRYRIPVLVLAALLLLLPIVLPAPDGLGTPAFRCIGVFLASVLLWVTGVLPLAVTSLSVFALLPLLGVMGPDEAFALFGNRAVFFILGALVLAASMISTGLSSRLALLAVSRFGRSERTFLLGVLVSAALLSFTMPEHAVAAMLFPVLLEVAHALGLKPKQSRYGAALFLALGWGAVIGGIATLLGGARNPLAIAILYQTTGETIGFFEWMQAAVPLSLGLLVVAAFALDRMASGEKVDFAPCRKVLERKLAEAGPLSPAERRLAFIAVGTVAAWIILGHSLGLAQISILAAVLLFVFRVTDWPSIEEHVNWGIIVMYGGAVALGAALVDTGAAHWIATELVSHAMLPPVLVLMLLAVGVIFLTEGISNAAAVAVVLPIALSLTQFEGIGSGKLTVFVVALPAGLAFCLPMGSPPNAIAYSAGFFKLRDILVLGLFLKLVGLVMILALMTWVWPHLGLTFGAG